jgi:hypothetical protein
VLAKIVAAIAIIFCARILLRPEWRFALQNGSILLALILDLTLSIRVFEPSLLRASGPLVVPGTEMLYWISGHMPGGFALPAGLGDLFIGLTAPWMTKYVLRENFSPKIVVTWNLIGILDFVTAFSTGFAFNTPTGYPLVLIPGFLVPLALAFHLHSLRKLQRGTYKRS